MWHDRSLVRSRNDMDDIRYEWRPKESSTDRPGRREATRGHLSKSDFAQLPISAPKRPVNELFDFGVVEEVAAPAQLAGDTFEEH
jgi:hypothetical protein